MTNLDDLIKAQYPFEKYLEGIAFEDYHGDKEHWEDWFSNWVVDLEGGEYIKHGNVLAKMLLEVIAKI